MNYFGLNKLIFNFSLITEADLVCLANHIDLYHSLKYTTSWSRSDLAPDGALAQKIFLVKSQVVENFPQAQYNWCTPKFESLDAWPRLIKFLGPPMFQSTDTWEATHLPNKADSMLSNHHAVELDVLKKVLIITRIKYFVYKNRLTIS